MNRRPADGFTAQTAAELHPDPTFEEVERPKRWQARKRVC